MSFDAGAVTSRLELSLAGWKKSVEAVKADQQSLSDFALRHKESIEKLGKTMTLVGGSITAALGAAVIKTANFGDEINDMSQRTGIATEILSGYKLAADNSGTSIEGVATALKFLSQRMVDFKAGGEESIALFKELGVEVTNTDGSLRDSNEVMLDIAERFSQMEDGAEKTALAVKLFGRSGMEMIPFLNMGKEGLREYYENAQKFGAVVSQDAARACDEFNDKLGNMKASLQGAGREIGQVMMPVVQGLIEKVTDIVVKLKDWVGAHPALFAAVTTLAGGLGAVMVTLGPMLIILPKLVAGWTAFAAVLHTSTAALAASLAGLTALAAGAVMVYTTINTMIKAKEASVEADYEMSASNTEVGKKLREMADAAGVSRAELIKLTEKYGDNNVALQQAINSGKDQDETLQKLHAVVVKHREEVKKQEEALQKLTDLANNKTNPTLTTLGEKTKEVNEAVKTQFTAIVNTADGWSTLEQQMLDMAREVPGAYDDMVADVNSSLDRLVQNNKDAAGKIGEDHDAATTEISSKWDDLVRDITIGWADGIQGLVEGTKSFKDFCADTWGAIKQTFFRMIADMITKWITEGITKMVSSAASGAAAVSTSLGTIGTTLASLATSVGAVITTLIGAVATGIVTIAGAIAGAIVALATGIAAAATALAAAAPALLTVGAVAVAIYAGFKAVEALLGSGGGGSGDGMGRVVERQDRVWAVESWWMPQTAALLTALEIHLVDIYNKIVDFFPKIDNLAGCFVTQNNVIKTHLGYVKTEIVNGFNNVVTAIGGVPGASSGALVMSPSLVMVGENAPRVPEVILPLPELGAFARGMAATGAGAGGGAGGSGSQQVFVFKPIIIDKGDKWMIRFVQENLNHGALRVPVSAIGG